MFAAESPSAEFTQQAMLLAVLVFQIFVGWAQFTGRKDAQRRQVTFETEFASKSEMDELRKALHELDEDLSKLKDNITDNGEKRREAIEAKVFGVSAKVDALRSDMGTRLESLVRAISDLATSQSATNATLSAWKESPPWKIRP